MSPTYAIEELLALRETGKECEGIMVMKMSQEGGIRGEHLRPQMITCILSRQVARWFPLLSAPSSAAYSLLCHRLIPPSASLPIALGPDREVVHLASVAPPTFTTPFSLFVIPLVLELQKIVHLRKCIPAQLPENICQPNTLFHHHSQCLPPTKSFKHTLLISISFNFPIGACQHR